MSQKTLQKESLMMRMVRKVEIIGNKIPHPMYMFLVLTAIFMVVSAICASMGVSVTYMAANNSGEVAEKTVAVVNMLSKESLATFLGKIISNFCTNAAFQPIVVLGMFMMVAEQTGFFKAGLRKLLANCPDFLATYVLCVVCICCNICATGGNLLAITLGAVLYKARGKSPIAGILLGWACVGAGYTANLLPASLDVTLFGVANGIVEPMGYTLHPLSNWYFMIVATLVLAGVCTVIGDKFLTKLYPDPVDAEIGNERESLVSENESRGLKFAGIAFLICTAVLLITIVPKNGMLRNAEGKLLPTSPFISSLVMILALYFLFVGVAYGYGSGTIKNKDEIPKLLSKGLGAMGSILVVLFFAVQCIYVFNTSNLGTIISIKGEAFLRSTGLNGIPLLILFSLLTMVCNMFITSSATKWLMFAPIFLPMLTNVGIHPAFTAIAYRIGDTCTNNMSPLSTGVPIALAMIEQYRPKSEEVQGSGVGTVISAQIPFSIMFFITLVILECIFYFCNIPLGPGM